MPTLKELLEQFDNVTLEVADLISQTIDHELAELLQKDCELVYDPVSESHTLVMRKNKNIKNDRYEEIFKHLTKEEPKMEGYYGFGAVGLNDSSAMDTWSVTESMPQGPVEKECMVCKGTGKDKRNIIQKPCEKCTGTGKILEESKNG